MSIVRSALLTIVCASLLGSPASAAPAELLERSSYLALSGDLYDSPTSSGQRFYAVEPSRATAHDGDNDGSIDTVILTYNDPDSSASWRLRFTAPDGEHLGPGFYGGARRSSSSSVPGLDVSGEGRGCNDLIGSFTVLFAEFDRPDGAFRVKGFAARFEQHCEGLNPSLKGAVAFNAPSGPLLASAVFNDTKQRLTFYGERLMTAASIVVDGVAVPFKAKRNGALVVANITLAAGEHTAVVIGTDGVRSPEFRFLRDGEPSAPATMSLEMRGEPGDYILGDRTYRKDDGLWLIQFGDRSGNRLADLVHFRVTDPDFTSGFSLGFSTAGVGVDLQPGVYKDARRFAPTVPGTPGLAIYGEGRACNELSGSFTITDVDIDYSQGFPTLRRFAAFFEQHCEMRTPALRGTIRYQAPPAPRVASARVASGRRTLTLRVVGLSPSGEVFIDGRSATHASDGEGLISVTTSRLGRGPHSITVRTAAGIASVPFILLVD